MPPYRLHDYGGVRGRAMGNWKRKSNSLIFPQTENGSGFDSSSNTGRFILQTQI